jgi:hypothetical protein
MRCWWELLPFERNPMDLVTIKGVGKRSKKPIVLTVRQCLTIISLMPELTAPWSSSLSAQDVA